MSKHALLSASGSSRWLECPPSAHLELQFPKKSSSYADEGTAAHELCELAARYWLEEISEAEYESKLAELAKGEYYNAEMQESPRLWSFFSGLGVRSHAKKLLCVFSCRETPSALNIDGCE